MLTDFEKAVDKVFKKYRNWELDFKGALEALKGAESEVKQAYVVNMPDEVLDFIFVAYTDLYLEAQRAEELEDDLEAMVKKDAERLFPGDNVKIADKMVETHERMIDFHPHVCGD